jgi:hypothetical protein
MLDALLLLLSCPSGRDCLLSDAPSPPAFARLCLAALDRCNGLDDCCGDEDDGGGGGGGGGGLDAALLERLLRVRGPAARRAASPVINRRAHERSPGVHRCLRPLRQEGAAAVSEGSVPPGEVTGGCALPCS